MTDEDLPYIKPIAGPKVIFDKQMVFDLVKLHGVKGAINRITGKQFQKKWVGEIVISILKDI